MLGWCESQLLASRAAIRAAVTSKGTSRKTDSSHRVAQLVAIQEQSIEHEHDAWRCSYPWQVKVLVGTEIVDGGAVPTRTGGAQWVEQVVSQPFVVEGVQPEPTR